MWLKTRIVLAIVGIVLIVLAIVLRLYVVPEKVTKTIIDTVQLTNGSEAYERWENLPIPIKYKIYFFNVSNPEEVQNGMKPQVQEIGPYIYNQERWKTDIVEENDKLSYSQNLRFTFAAEESYPLSDTDAITVANLPLMAIVTMAESLFPHLLKSLNSILPKLFDNPTDLFVRTTPRDFLFDGIFVNCDAKGFAVSMTCSLIEKHAPPTLVRLEDRRLKFSLLSHKDTIGGDGNFTINSGTIDIEKLGEINAWQGSPTLNTWVENSTCNEIVGTDTTIYPPFQTPESTINVFSVDICRSVKLEYSEDITYSGILGHRFVVGPNMLASPSTRLSNQCYCLNKTEGIRGNDGCLLDGAMELWTCQKAPIVLTLPHFYSASSVYIDGVDGVNPDGNLHEMFVDLEPNTGTPLRGHKKAQFNIFYRKIANIKLTEDLNTTLMPVVWLDEGIDLPDDLVDELYDQLFNVMKKVTIIFWTIVGIGIFLILVVIAWSIAICYKKRSEVV